eukprot:snap_masked-scaffold_7-processed-gene-19.32-mRNA-1 protein AED:1.00 eAED:1.00 QI:0/0/0/0/1/1/3/0/424
MFEDDEPLFPTFNDTNAHSNDQQGTDPVDFELMNVFMLENSFDENHKLSIIRNVQKGMSGLANFLVTEVDFTEKLIAEIKSLGTREKRHMSMVEKRYMLLRFFLDESQHIFKKYNTCYQVIVVLLDLEKVFDMDPPDYITDLAIQRLRILNDFLSRAPNVTHDVVDEDDVNFQDLVERPNEVESDAEHPGSATIKYTELDTSTVNRLFSGAILVEHIVDNLRTTNGMHGGRKRSSKVRFSLQNRHIDGWWLYSDSILNGLDSIRERYMNTSWIARKMLRVMERHFSVIKLKKNNKVLFIGQSKLFASGIRIYKCDGEMHFCSDRSLLFPIAIPQIKFYRAITFRTANGQLLLVVENYYQPEGKNMLQTIYKFDEKEENELIRVYNSLFQSDEFNRYHKKYEVTGWVMKCSQKPKFGKTSKPIEK